MTAPAPPATTPTTDAQPPAPQPLSRVEAITRLKALAAERETLTEYDRRVTDLRELSANYDKWQALLFSRVRLELHYMLRALVWVLVILIAVILLDTAVRRYFDSLPPERSRLRNLRVLLIAMVQTTGCLLILIVIFGKPADIYTFLGLIGAGLAVALKDFILGFIGWFFLMADRDPRRRLGGDSRHRGRSCRGRPAAHGAAGERQLDGLRPSHRAPRVVLQRLRRLRLLLNCTTHGQWLWDEIRIPVLSLDSGDTKFEPARPPINSWKKSIACCRKRRRTPRTLQGRGGAP